MKNIISIVFLIIALSSFGKNLTKFKESFINVQNFGAIPDDQKEDTFAFELALKAAKKRNIKMLYIPKGLYDIDSIRLDDVINIIGEEGTILKKIPYAGKWSRMFVIVRDEDHPNEIYSIKNVEFDGNLSHQGNYLNYQLEQQHLIFIAATNDREERVQVDIDNCFFQNSVADGITVFRNAEVTITNCKAKDIFRGAFVSNGGNSKIKIKNFEILKSDIVSDSGFDIEVIGDGFYGNKKVEIEYENIILRGKFHIGINDYSSVKATNIKAENTHFYIIASNSKVKIDSSDFSINAAKKNRIYYPHDVQISNCNFTLEENDKKKDDLLSVFWLSKKNKSTANNKLVFENCNFSKTINNGRGTVFTLETDNLEKNNIFKLKNCSINKGFENGVLIKRGGRIDVNGGNWDVILPFNLNSQPVHYRQLDVNIGNINFDSKIKQILKTNSKPNSKDLIRINK